VRTWEGVKSNDENCESWAYGETGHIMKQNHGRSLLHYEEVSCPSAPN
jgi:hypothetical protein